MFHCFGRDDRVLNLVFLQDGRNIAIISTIAHSYAKTTVVLAQNFSDPPTLIASNVGSETYTYDKGPATMFGGRPSLEEREGLAKKPRLSFTYYDDPSQPDFPMVLRHLRYKHSRMCDTIVEKLLQPEVSGSIHL